MRPSGPGSTVNLGYVARPNGLGGAVVVHVDPSMAGILRRGLDVELLARDGRRVATTVRSAAPIRGGVRLTLEAVGDRNASEALVGATVLVDRERLGLADDEWLDSDLVGLDVVTTEGRALGRVAEVIATGANDVVVVRAEGGAEILVPAVAHAIAGVDLAAGRMTVEGSALEYGEAAAPRPKAGK